MARSRGLGDVYKRQVLTVCPECKQPTLQKVYQVANVHFKGGGWYVKDNYGPDKGGDGIRE
jgi:predicted nucleic acid-binding Zn ribbon protein